MHATAVLTPRIAELSIDVGLQRVHFRRAGRADYRRTTGLVRRNSRENACDVITTMHFYLYLLVRNLCSRSRAGLRRIAYTWLRTNLTRPINPHRRWRRPTVERPAYGPSKTPPTTAQVSHSRHQSRRRYVRQWWHLSVQPSNASICAPTRRHIHG